MQTLPSENECWEAMQVKDASYDGVFVVAVRSTRIYCRPTCSARMPKRENVTFYATPQEAAAAGFRACKRCRPDSAEEDHNTHLRLAQQICEYLKQAETPPTLAQLSEQFHLSQFHLQRVFKRVTGVSPRQYYDAHRIEQFKNGLKDGEPVTRALYDAGFSSVSQLYPGHLGMTPTEYQRGGAGMQIRYSIVNSYLGWLLVAGTERGVCVVRLRDSVEELLEELENEYPKADLIADESGLGEWVNAIVEYLDRGETSLERLPLDIKATAFQRRVWEALRAIPYGSTRSYGEIAKIIGQPTATRAVAQACGANPVPLVIPCHRVISSNGDLGGYSMGIERKRQLLAAEKTAVQPLLLTED